MFRLVASFHCPGLLASIDEACPEAAVAGWLESLTISLWEQPENWFDFVSPPSLSLLITRLLAAMEQLENQQQLSALCEMGNHYLDRLLPGWHWPSLAGLPPFLERFIDSGRFLDDDVPWIALPHRLLFVRCRAREPASKVTLVAHNARGRQLFLGQASVHSRSSCAALARKMRKPSVPDWVEVRLGKADAPGRLPWLTRLVNELVARKFHRELPAILSQASSCVVTETF